MFAHMGEHAVSILEKPNMAELIHLIVAYRLSSEQLLHVFHICFTARKARNAGPRESDF